MTNLGIEQWFIFQEPKPVREAIEALRELGVTELRTNLSWADWDRPGGPEWYDWVLKELHHAGLNILPVLFYTPVDSAKLLPHQTREDARTSHAPENPGAFVEFCETIEHRYGKYLGEYRQVWNEPNNHAYWNQKIDPDGLLFEEMANRAIDVFHAHGKKVTLGGIIPPYDPWIERHLDLAHRADALGIQAFPGTWDKMEWKGWDYAINSLVRPLLLPTQQVWITETGLSTVTLEDTSETMRHQREKMQVEYAEKVSQAPAERAYFHCLFDQHEEHPTDNFLNKGTPPDPRAYHFGLIDTTGRKKPLYYAWQRHPKYGNNALAA